MTDAHFWYVDATGDLYLEAIEDGEDCLKLTMEYTYKAVIE